MHMEIFGKCKKQFDFTKNPGDSKHIDETNKKVIQKFKNWETVDESLTSLFWDLIFHSYLVADDSGGAETFKIAVSLNKSAKDCIMHTEYSNVLIIS